MLSDNEIMAEFEAAEAILRGVHKNTDDDTLRFCLRCIDQRHMAGM
jgi:hypothetical protein